MVSHLHVTVQQHVVFCLHLLQRLVVSLSEAPVLFQLDNPHRRMVLPQVVDAPVRRGIIGHDHLSRPSGILHHRGQILPEHPLPVPIQYHDSYLHHLSFMFQVSGFKLKENACAVANSSLFTLHSSLKKALSADLSKLNSPSLTLISWLSYSGLASAGDSSTRI